MASGTVTKLATRFPHTEVMRIYLAAPLFTAAERAFNADLARRLEARRHRVFLPQRDVPTTAGVRRTRRVFDRCLEGLSTAELVIAVCDGPVVDDGTAWEVGYAYAKRIPVYGLRTDRRQVAADESVNLMTQESVARLFRSVAELLAAPPLGPARRRRQPRALRKKRRARRARGPQVT